MLSVVIISQNQSEFLIEFKNAINSKVPYIVILDRCTDNSVEICKTNNIPYKENNVGILRQVSMARNIGLNHFKDNDILFLDGDRVPLFDINKLEVKEEVGLILCEKDPRSKYAGQINPVWGSWHNGCFASAIYIKNSAIKRVIEKYGFLWDEDFIYWGEEDRHLGDLLWDVGANCEYLPPEFRVKFHTTNFIDKHEDFNKMGMLRVQKNIKYNLIEKIYNNTDDPLCGECG